MRNIKLTIEFDGTNYAGWQKQKNAVTVQQKLEDTIEKLTGDETKLTGSSRTDTGVHARGFVANFYTESSIPASNFRDALNSKLPRDIVILMSEEVELDFHSRYSCTGKQYSYTILNRKYPSAMDRNFVYHYKNPLNIEAMSFACKLFLGQHDFSAFKSKGSSTKSSIRTIKSAFIEKNNEKVLFFVEADGFLYNMVRIMVGTLIDVGISKIEVSDINRIIDSKDRNKAGKTVPASGLCLEHVYYI